MVKSLLESQGWGCSRYLKVDCAVFGLCEMELGLVRVRFGWVNSMHDRIGLGMSSTLPDQN